MGGVGFQIALLDSDAFEIVPGSHRRWRSPEEFECMSHYKGAGGGGKTEGDGGPMYGLTKYSPLPEMVAVQLKAGQTMFWDGDLIHRGRMEPSIERLTLHCSMGRRRNTETTSRPKPPADGDRRLMWRTHPDVRAALPRQWQKEAWDEWAAGQAVPPEVGAWHCRRGASAGQVDFATQLPE